MSGADPGVASVLVVDDAPANLILLADILEDAGYDVRVANGGGRALTLVDRDPPDLVLLDVNLGDMDGYRVCREIKARGRVKTIPVIFLSAADDDAARTRAFEAGGDEYLTKPFEAADVLTRIAQQLERSRATPR